MKKRFLFTDGDSKYYDGVKHKTLFEDGNEYTAYWTNGERVTTCTTYAPDKYTAEDDLKNILIEYWLKDNDTARMKAAFRAIRHATTGQLADIINRTQGEMTARERLGMEPTRLPMREGVRRIKDIHRRFSKWT